MEQQQKQQQSLEAMSDSATKRDLSDALTILHDASQAGRTAIDEILTRKYAIPRRGSNDRRTLSSTHCSLPEYLDNLAASPNMPTGIWWPAQRGSWTCSRLY
jgi:hypothetical protein